MEDANCSQEGTKNKIDRVGFDLIYKGRLGTWSDREADEVWLGARLGCLVLRRRLAAFL